MRVSKYNIYVNLKNHANKSLIIQGVKGSFDIVDSEIAQILKSGEDDISKINQISDECLTILNKRGYITDNSEDEEFALIEKLSHTINETRKKGISITLLPTYNCNFRCVYCFERDLQKKDLELLNKRMPVNIVDAVFEQLKKYKENGMHINNICLFGGEPLLYANMDIVNYICDKAMELEIPISCISNGYDLDKYIDLVQKYKFVSIQITIDGIEKSHDNRRFLLGGHGTYNKIIENVDKALDAGVDIVLRTNVNKKNLDQIEKLIELYTRNEWTKKSNFQYYFKSTLRCFERKEDELSEIELMKILQKYYGEESNSYKFNSIYGSLSRRINNMLKNKSIAPMKSGYCGANTGMYTIDPYGDIYPCWDVLMENQCVIGHVNTDTKTFDLNEKCFDWKERTVDKLEECKNCRYMFFCGGGCTAQAKFVHDSIKKVYCDDFQTLFEQVVSNVCDDFLDIKANERGLKQQLVTEEII